MDSLPPQQTRVRSLDCVSRYAMGEQVHREAILLKNALMHTAALSSLEVRFPWIWEENHAHYEY